MKQKRIPLRMCVSCREMKPKNSLLRVVKNKNGEISVDHSRKQAGRGAYICKNISCIEKAKKLKQLDKTLGANVNEDIYTNIKKILTDMEEPDGK